MKKNRILDDGEYILKYKGKFITNCSPYEPLNPDCWFLINPEDVTMEEMHRWHTWLGCEVKNIFLKAKVQIEIIKV